MKKLARILASIAVAVGLALGLVAVTSGPADAATHYSKSRMTKSEYKKIKTGMSIKKVRSIVGSNGKRTWYYEDSYQDYNCTDWSDDSTCDYTTVRTVYKDYEWKNTSKYGRGYVSFENGKVTSKSWWT